MDSDQILQQFAVMQDTIKLQQEQLERLTEHLALLSNTPSSSAPIRKEPKVADPEFFRGDRRKSRSFLLQLKNVF